MLTKLSPGDCQVKVGHGFARIFTDQSQNHIAADSRGFSRINRTRESRVAARLKAADKSVRPHGKVGHGFARIFTDQSQNHIAADSRGFSRINRTRESRVAARLKAADKSVRPHGKAATDLRGSSRIKVRIISPRIHADFRGSRTT